MRPKRRAEKPIPLMERIIQTHSNQGDLVVDPFCGSGTTGVAALKLGRRFLGNERIEEDAVKANERCQIVVDTLTPDKKECILNS
jgi:site-specific DNA-methyltransferase (adenine-specific)